MLDYYYEAMMQIPLILYVICSFQLLYDVTYMDAICTQHYDVINVNHY